MLSQAEISERKAAKEKAQAAADQSVSVDGAADAAKRWAEVRSAFLAWAPFYEQPFEERFIVLEDASAYDACASDLQNHKLKSLLLHCYCPAFSQNFAVRDDSSTTAIASQEAARASTRHHLSLRGCHP